VTAAKKTATKRRPAEVKESEPTKVDVGEPELVEIEPKEAAEVPKEPTEEPEPPPSPVGKVNFVPSRSATGVNTPSGASFSLTPLVALRMTCTDAEHLAAAGFGTLQGE
jgi:hypothetical protein